MKKGFTLLDIVVLLVIFLIIGLIASVIVKGVIKDIKKDSDKIVADNYMNTILYSVESYIKNNKQIPVYCTISNNKIFYDKNNNNIFDSDELLCDFNCEDNKCIKYFITYNDIKDDNVKCDKIYIDNDNYIEISSCFVNNNEIRNYVFKTKIDINSFISE